MLKKLIFLNKRLKGQILENSPEGSTGFSDMYLNKHYLFSLILKRAVKIKHLIKHSNKNIKAQNLFYEYISWELTHVLTSCLPSVHLRIKSDIQSFICCRSLDSYSLAIL